MTKSGAIQHVYEVADNHRFITIIWTIDDILGTAATMDINMNNDQAWEVLKTLKNNHDSNYGITWDRIESLIVTMYN
jgi:hypothetical protein